MGFIIGLFIGFALGAIIMAVLAANGRRPPWE